jgi:hypothetical protein
MGSTWAALAPTTEVGAIAFLVKRCHRLEIDALHLTDALPKLGTWLDNC